MRIHRSTPLLAAGALFALTATASAQGQVQDFTGGGTISNDGFGWHSSLSGDTLFVGAIGDDTVFSGGGALYVFERVAGAWVEVQKITNADTIDTGEFGNTSAVVGDRAVIGAHKNGTGKVYHYERVAGVWSEVETLTASDGAPMFHFGHHVAMAPSGTTAIVGQMRDDYLGFETGSAYVFELVGGSFVEVAKLTGSDSGMGDRFGRTVATDGNRTVVCALNHNGSEGKVYVFERDDNGTPGDPTDDAWPEVAKLTASDPDALDNFGRGLSFEGDRIVVGASNDSQGGVQTGSAYVFEKVAGVWTEVQKLNPDDGGVGDQFGTSIKLEGDTLLVGARLHKAGGINNTGAIYVFKRVGGSWVQATKLVADDAGVNWLMGSEVSVSIDGDRVIAPAWGANSNTGHVYVFQLPRIYCNGKLNTAGCTPEISYSGGCASMSDPEPFEITASLIVNNKNGIYFYSKSGPASIPFQGGTLCVAAPVSRTGAQNSAGNSPPDDCSGSYSFDMNALIQAGTDPGLVAGTVVNGQYWYRDPNHPVNGSGLSNAVEFEICP